MMKNIKKMPVSVVLVGMGGYAQYYLMTLLKEFPPDEVKLLAVVDPFPELLKQHHVLKQQGIPIIDSLSNFYGEGHSADLVIVSSPIHFHVQQSCEALHHGSNVLCEKPIGATIQEAEHLIKEKNDSGRWVMIGYQWSYSDAIQSLKKDILQGVYGKPLRLKTLCFWPRDKGYYKRNDWAGKKKDEADRWILDSPANNAMAHFLHNMFYVLGDKVHTSISPVDVTAELYRTNPIENFDSVAARILTAQGTELLFYASHAVSRDQGPLFCFEFEKAAVIYEKLSDDIIAIGHRNNVKYYGSPEVHHFSKLFKAVAAVRKQASVLCGPEAARSQTLCVNGFQESMPDAAEFPKKLTMQEGKTRCWVKGIAEAFYDCYEKGILPSEANIPWARKGKLIYLRNYNYFPGGVCPEDKKCDRNESP